MSVDPKQHVTLILQAISTNPRAVEELLPVVYDELRAMARDKLRQERSSHTLQATALVHEAYMRLVDSKSIGFENRGHFFGACANAMRQILVDHARKHGAVKRGSGRSKESLTHADVADSSDLDTILDVDAAIETLRGEDVRAAQIVELRYFGGLEMSEIAEAIGISERTAHREWSFAKARLFQLLGSEGQKQ